MHEPGPYLLGAFLLVYRKFLLVSSGNGSPPSAYGYLLLHALLKAKGLVINPMGTYRIYMEEALQVRINSPLLVNDRQTVLQLCLANAGYGCVSEQSARPYLDRGELVSVLDEWNAPFSGWHLIYPRQRFVPPISGN